MNKIKVMEISQVFPSAYICDVDDDSYPYGTYVDPSAYDPEEQDWQHVIAITGYADLPTLTLAYHSGEHHTERVQASATVWVLVDEDGRMVTQDVEID